jgi:N-acetylmuramoyl-L-alanine amidase
VIQYKRQSVYYQSQSQVMTKKVLFTPLIAAALLILSASGTGAVSPVAGKIIALDAGHGGGETGAVGYCGETAVLESDVNVAVRSALKALLEASEAVVFEVPPLPLRRDRTAAAEEAGANALISIHHNGSSNRQTDYTQSFVTQKEDRQLATPIQSALVSALGLPDKGIKSDGYGMTVYGSFPGVLTEAYFVTSTAGACDYVNYLSGATDTRVQREAQAMYDGLTAYFSGSGGGDGGGGGNKCEPWPQCR